MKKKIDIRQSGKGKFFENIGELYKQGFINKDFVIKEMTNHSTPCCYEPEEEK